MIRDSSITSYTRLRLQMTSLTILFCMGYSSNVSEKKKPKEPDEPEKTKEKQPIGGLIRDFMPFVRLGLDLLGCFFRKLRVPF